MSRTYVIRAVHPNVPLARARHVSYVCYTSRSPQTGSILNVVKTWTGSEPRRLRWVIGRSE
eukprot:5891232-Prymnesium_polylepis.1